MADQTTGLTRRQRRKTLTDKQIAAMPRKAKRYILADPEQRGLYLRVPMTGPVVFTAVARHQGQQTWATIGTADVLSIEEARERARTAIRRIKQGLQPFEATPVKPDSVADVAAQWLKRHVEKNKLRTGADIKRQLDVYVLPRIGERPFGELRRGDIARLLDAVEDEHGAWVADAVLATLRSIAVWFAARSDDYVVPFVRGQRRVPAHARKRARILNDEELRAVWRTAEGLTKAQQAGERFGGAAFARFIQVLLLTAQRRDKVATMQWSDLDGDLWTIRTEPREKGNPGLLRLPSGAMAIIARQPRLISNPYVFSGRGGGHMRGFRGLKIAFDKKLIEPDKVGDASPAIPRWTLHDLRRTARSLMSRAGVQTEIAERVLGHARPGVEATYDRHSYTEEMGHALERLAQLIETIVRPPVDNVKPLRRRL